MSIDFAHLHCHSIYSIQDAMPQVKDYVKAIELQNQNSTKYNVIGFAITDHGNVSGIVDEYSACRADDKSKITKDVYGIEAYHCLDVNNNLNHDRFHLVLLAKTQEGLNNIYKIASHAGLNLYKGKTKNFPITDINYICDNSDGIIALSACLGGLIPQCIINGNIADAEKYALMFKNTFDEFYLEIQATENPQQLMVNAELINISNKLNIPLVITSDSHYINKGEKKYHNILKDISHQQHFTDDAHLRTPEEFEEYCIKHNIPLSCISNTGEIAKKCNVNPRPINPKEYLPVYDCPPGYDENSYLRKLCWQFLKEKMIKYNVENPLRYINDMLYQLDVICNAGFASYFLILWDWFKWCRDNDILMGFGRGSAAGSLVTYVLDITKADPIKNNLIFERFLSPERLSYPDVDSDVPRDKRAQAIEYLQKKYGYDKVCQIITFGKYKLKNTTKDILSNLGVDFKIANSLTREIPDMIDGKEVTWDLIESVHNNPDNDKFSNFTDQEKSQLENIYQKFDEIFQQYPVVYDGIKSICNCLKSTGIHAGGVIVCKKPLMDNFQICAPSGSAVLPIIQFQMTDLEFFSLLNQMGGVTAGYMLGQAKALMQSLPFVQVYVRNS